MHILSESHRRFIRGLSGPPQGAEVEPYGVPLSIAPWKKRLTQHKNSSTGLTGDI